MENLLYSYKNGNVNVSLYSDGTSIREYEGEPNPTHPCSMDVKITNKCGGVYFENGVEKWENPCAWCHEKSNPDGEHGDLDKLLDVLKAVPAGVEIAIGGGAPQQHPQLLPFLQELKSRGLVANMTINQKHFKSDNNIIINMIKNDLIKGVGCSFNAKQFLPDILPALQATDNLVFHVIMGINPVSDIELLYNFCRENNKKCKILILGYKQYGFGLNYYLKNKHIEDNKYQWFIKLAKHFKQKDLVLSFDNLAIDQLNLKRYFTDEGWDKFFMGRDGIFTMYIDAVKQQYAKSSTTPNRISFDDMSLLEFFKSLKC